MKGKYERTPLIKAKISKALKGRKLSKETRRKISIGLQGRKVSESTREKISNSNMGRYGFFTGKKHTLETRRLLSEKKRGVNIKDYNNLAYSSIHSWLRRNFGKANECGNLACDSDSIFYEWALLKGFAYHRNRNNFVMLCRACHTKYDRHNGSIVLR